MRPPRLSFQAAGAALGPRAEPPPRAATPSPHPAPAGPAPRHGGGSARARHRRLALAALVVMHVAAVLGLLSAGRLRDVQLDATPLMVSVVDAPTLVAPPRALPPAGARIPPPPPPTLPPITPEAAAAPAPLVAPAQPPSPAAPAAPVETPPAPPASLPRTIPPSAIQYIVPPAPVYPRVSARMRESGKAVVRVFIDEDGLPRTVQLAASTGFARLDDAALAAVRRCRFRPWLDNGAPVAAWANIPIEFELPT